MRADDVMEESATLSGFGLACKNQRQRLHTVSL